MDTSMNIHSIFNEIWTLVYEVPCYGPMPPSFRGHFHLTVALYKRSRVNHHECPYKMSL